MEVNQAMYSALTPHSYWRGDRATPDQMSIDEIQEACGPETTRDHADRMRILLINSEFVETPITDIPEPEWLRLLALADSC